MSPPSIASTLLVFARYPEVGRCKTRLIPAVGPEGAADLHRQMTHHTLHWARSFSSGKCKSLAVHFAGGNIDLMRTEFGNDLIYVPQVEGDLGQRIRAACLSARESGSRHILLAGTDCPELLEDHAEGVRRRLTSHNASIVPATDGGYVLMGLQLNGNDEDLRLFDAVFNDIDWGTSSVLATTLDRLDRAGLKSAIMPPLRDVDLPEDLEVWHRVQEQSALKQRSQEQLMATGTVHTVAPDLSVIIPVWNKEALLKKAISSASTAHRTCETEVIVVGSGQSAEARETCIRHGIQFLSSAAGRSKQMNLGASHARGKFLLFLHADTLLPERFQEEVSRILTTDDAVAGAFQLKIDSPRSAARIVERGIRWRCNLFQMPYGDQAIFLRAEDFTALRGFPEMPLMEDFELVRRLNKQGKIMMADSAVTTSARRWQRRGFWKTTILNQFIVLAYRLGASPTWLAKIYRGSQPKKPRP